jgi:hypothetical protein
MTRPEPSPESARLAAGLRELKERTGLSLAGLAAKTTFSKSSWERYLNGRTLPPRPAVQELCRLAGEPPGRYLALRDLAQSEWSDAPKEPTPTTTTTTTTKPSPSPTPTPAPAPGGATDAAGHRGATAVAVLVSVSALVFGAVVLTLLLLPHGSEGARPSASSSASPSVTGPRCRDTGCEGEDPLVMQCDPAPQTLAEHVTATGASVQLRYSEMCGATWVRMWGTRIGDAVELRGHLARVRNRIEADTYVHTLMATTRAGTVIRACFLPATGGERECFQAMVNRATSEPTPGTHASPEMPASGTRAQGGPVGRPGRPVGR